jgi:hypothetical protein
VRNEREERKKEGERERRKEGRMKRKRDVRDYSQT